MLLPHQIDFATEQLIYLPTSRPKIKEASFLDGRTDFANGSPVVGRFDELLSYPISHTEPNRYIFHIGFCGSTFLSRLIDSPGHSLVLREPNVLAALANVRAAIDRGEVIEGRFDSLLNATRALLNRSWTPNERVVIKPSNWANNLVQILCGASSTIRPLFLTMNRSSFLHAVLRGGSPRLAFAARAAVHLSSLCDQDSALVSAALNEGTDIEKLLKVALALHHIQVSLFKRVAYVGNWSAENSLTFDELQADPKLAARKAATALDIQISDEAIVSNLKRWSSSNAKDPITPYSVNEEKHAISRLVVANTPLIDNALRWAETAIDAKK